MPPPLDLREPIKGLGPISAEHAEELMEQARAAVGPSPVAREPEDQSVLDALTTMQELHEYRIAAGAAQIKNAADGYFHEREVILPVEEAFAARHGVTVEDLEAAWGQRRKGIRGQLFRRETEQRAALRDEFFALIDAIGAEQMGEGYDYGQFIAETSPDVLLQAVQSRLDVQNQG